MATVTTYPVSEYNRTGYSIVSDDGKRAYAVTPEHGPGRFSPQRSWVLWKSGSLNTIGRFPANEAGLARALERAQALAEGQVAATS